MHADIEKKTQKRKKMNKDIRRQKKSMPCYRPDLEGSLKTQVGKKSVVFTRTHTKGEQLKAKGRETRKHQEKQRERERQTDRQRVKGEGEGETDRQRMVFTFPKVNAFHTSTSSHDRHILK